MRMKVALLRGTALIEFIPNFFCRPQMLATLGNVMEFGV